MRAIVYRNYGSPSVLALEEVDRPEPTADEVLVKVHATTVNRTDCGFLRGKPFIVRFFSGLRGPKHPILGSEYAGEIVAVGRNVTTFAVGDRAFGFNDDRHGAHAEYKTEAESGMIAIMPAGLSYAEAAPIAEGAHYALFYLRAANIGPGTRLLINGATGAIGSAAVQLAKQRGATITAVCHAANRDLVRALGADTVIAIEEEDFTRRPEMYDVVLDAVGKSTFGACKPLLAPGGIYMSTDLGPRAQNPALALWTARIGDRKVRFPIPSSRQEDLIALRDLVETGAFRPVIDRTYPLEQIPEAYRYVESGQKIGNVVISVSLDAEKPLA